MDGQWRDTPAMILRNRDAAESSQEVVASQHDRQDDDSYRQPEKLRSPSEDQRESGVGINQALSVEPGGEVEQFGRKDADAAGDGGQDRPGDISPSRG